LLPLALASWCHFQYFKQCNTSHATRQKHHHHVTSRARRYEILLISSSRSPSNVADTQHALDSNAEVDDDEFDLTIRNYFEPLSHASQEEEESDIKFTATAKGEYISKSNSPAIVDEVFNISYEIGLAQEIAKETDTSELKDCPLLLPEDGFTLGPSIGEECDHEIPPVARTLPVSKLPLSPETKVLTIRFLVAYGFSPLASLEQLKSKSARFIVYCENCGSRHHFYEQCESGCGLCSETTHRIRECPYGRG
jgi:hypothetical protein